jgi:hypothetical protein
VKLRALLTVAAVAVAIPATLGGAGPASAAGPGYVTIQFGRSIEGSYTNPGCVPVPGILRLDTDVADLASLGFMATGTVNVDRASTPTEDCTNADIYADWADLQHLNATYGFQVVSEGLNHNDITGETPTEQRSESCGSLPDFTNEGFTRAWAEFAYPDDMHTPTIQKNVVSTCFAYGRVYSYTPTINVRSKIVAPWFEEADNVLGGECNVKGMACYSLTTTAGRHYTSPAGWANILKNETGDEWDDLQFYQLVTGSSDQSPSYSWDCTSTNWKLHWTSHTEMYCLNDFMSIIAAIKPSLVVTDPATVATAWGRGTP